MGASREHLDQLVFCGAQSLVWALPHLTSTAAYSV